MTKNIALTFLTATALLAAPASSWAASPKKSRAVKAERAVEKRADLVDFDLAEILKDPRLATPFFLTAKKECYCVAYEYRKTKVCVDPGPNDTCRAYEWREVEVCVKEHCHHTAD